MISVVICTHNPRADYLNRVMAALRGQTLPTSAWELLIVDNHSDEPVAGRFSVDWHPTARVVREDELGLTPARLRGIRESAGDLLVFLDDDNVAAPDYLEVAARVGAEFKQLGAWCGQVFPEFETPPAPSVIPLLPVLVLQEVDRDRWSNCSTLSLVGAGLVIRKSVCVEYARQLDSDPLRRLLDRRGGNSFSSAGDQDMICTCDDLHLGRGLFSGLKLTHLIPNRRLERGYLLRLIESAYMSHELMLFFRRPEAAINRQSFKRRLFDRIVEFCNERLSGPGYGVMLSAQNRGRRRARRLMKRINYDRSRFDPAML